MGIEIERKFLVSSNDWRPLVSHSINMAQGYLLDANDRTLRIRREDEAYKLTLKAPHPNGGLTRFEFEYEIPAIDGRQMLEELCLREPVSKIRHIVEHDGNRWEIDEFSGANAGLLIAEIELDNADIALSMPSWVGADVSGDPRFTNATLYRAPFSTWSQTDIRLVTLGKGLNA
ncbi:MAG: CYTH domain-containing protein [Pseudomonadota bacterium]